MEEDIVPDICEFCEASSEIKLKCVNCNLFLCQSCHFRLHAKIEGANDHIVINIEDLSADSFSENSRKVKMKQMSCVVHIQRTCLLFCRDCERLICPTCITESHTQHNFEEIDHVYHEKVKRLNILTMQINTEIPKVEIEATLLSEIKTEGEKNFLEIKSKILHHEDQIKENISMEAKTLLKQVDNRWNVTKDSLIKQRKQVQKSIDDLEKRKAQLNLILQSRQAGDFFVKNTEIKHLLPNTGLSPVQTEPFRFTPCEIDLEEIGVCHKRERFEFSRAFQTNYDISKMIEIEENQYVLYSYKTSTLQQVQFIDNTINIRKCLA